MRLFSKMSNDWGSLLWSSSSFLWSVTLSFLLCGKLHWSTWCCQTFHTAALQIIGEQLAAQVGKSCKMHQHLATNLAASLARSCYKSCINLAILHIIWPLSCNSCKILLPRILQDHLDVQESYKGLTKIPVQDLGRTSCKILHETLQDLAQHLAKSCTTSCKILHNILQLAPKLLKHSWNLPSDTAVSFCSVIMKCFRQIQATFAAEIKGYYKLITIVRPCWVEPY